MRTKANLNQPFTNRSWEGRVTHIHTAERAGAEMDELPVARCIAGVGIEGDRYATQRGQYSSRPHIDRQITLIEIETLEAIERDAGIVLLPSESRRNVTTRGVPLNHLVGVNFRVGEVLLYGGRLNTPCKYLDRLLDRELFTLLLNRCGLNCQIIEGGVIRPGNVITPAD